MNIFLFVSFSRDVDAIFTDTEGYVTLNSNWFEPVKLYIMTKCSTNEISSKTFTTSIIPNLEPNEWDVDIDQVNANRLQFEPQVLDDEFEFYVRILFFCSE